MIFATHDITQLDNEILRRDQIWFAEKDEFGKSTIFSLSDVKGIRDTTPYDKWYNAGQFGAIPIINELETKIKPSIPIIKSTIVTIVK